MREFLRAYWWLPATLFIACILALGVMAPAPPKSVSIAGGAPGGGYAAEALRISDALGVKKVKGEVLETTGSLDNLERLKSGEADIAIVQTGVVAPADSEEVVSLGAIYFEPLWVFHRAEIELQDLRGLEGLSVAMGDRGSGAEALARLLLPENGVEMSEMIVSPLGGRDAAAALKSGEVDVAMLVVGASADWIAELVHDPEISLLSIPRAHAYSRRYPYLAPVTLFEGVLDFEENIPASDVQLIAPAAQLVTRKDLHPAVQSLLIESAFEAHRGGSLLAPPKTFPTATLADIPLSSEARRYYERGPSFLRRLFPYSVANFLERAWVLLIPLATLAIPIFRAAPPLYRWRIRRKIYVWYNDLRELEARGRVATTDGERDKVSAELAKLQAETGHVEVPASYTDDLYRLRAHIRFVAELVDRLGDDNEARRI
ncbi:MAG: TAXI family TRAP transporter solute-binding subunit [Pseudomonadota bacterium]